MVLPQETQESVSGTSSLHSRGLSLAQKLSILVITLVIFVTTLVAYFAIREFRGHIVDEELRLLASKSHALGQEIESSLKELSGRVFYLANTPPIPGIVRASANAGVDPLDDSSIDQWYKRLNTLSVSMLRIDKDIRSIILYAFANDGVILTSVQRDGGDIKTGIGADWPDRETIDYFQGLEQAKQGHVHYSEIQVEQEGDAAEEPSAQIIRASILITDTENNPFALLSFSQDMRAIFRRSASGVISGQENRVYIANHNGQYLYHPQALNTAIGQGIPLRIQDEFAGLGHEIERQTESEIVQFYEHKGREVALSLRKIPLDSENESYLLAAVQRSSANVIALTEKAVWQVIIAASVVMAISLVLGLWFARSLVLPVKRLSKAASEFTAGTQTALLPGNLTREMGTLVGSFNAMLSRISENSVLMKAEVDFRQQAEARMQKNVLMLEQFHDISADRELSLDEKLGRLLRLGMSSLGVTLAVIFEQNKAGDYERWFHAGDDEGNYPFLNNACERIRTTRRTLALNAVDTQNQTEANIDGAGPGCFVGAPVFVGLNMTGVMAFAALENKEEQFVADATSFVQLASEWLSGELERMESVSAMREAEYQQRVILDNMFDGLISIDPIGTIESVNKMACSMLGYTPEEVIGHNIKMLMPEPYHSEHDGYLSSYMGGGGAKIIGMGREVLAQRKDGSVFPIDLAVTEVKMGHMHKFVGVLRDITERKEHEEKLRLQGAALESAANAIVITDVEGSIVWVNQAFTQFTGYDKESVQGSNPRILKSGEHGQDFYKAMWDCILSGDVWHGELVNRRDDGSHYIEEQTITPVADETGKISHFVAIKQDITERKKIEKMKSEFVSTVSHELRTPLTSIRGSLGLLLGGGMGDLSQQVKSLVEIACNNSERLVRLINDILDMEKIESGKMSFSLRPLELEVLINDAISANQGFAEEHQVKILQQNNYRDVRVLADSDRLTQVITNLISNAAKFSPDNSEIRVTVNPEGEGVRLSVADDGPGIPEEFQSRIFGKFSQADSSDTRQKGGTGLGLSISKAIVEKLGGQISFESQPGEGTVFHVDLPVWKITEVKQQDYTDGTRPQILICEDDPDVAVLLQMMMDKQGFSSDIANSAEAAWRQLSHCDYVAITLDLMLPGQDGLSFLHQLRGEERTKDLPVIVVSAIADQEKKNLKGDTLTVLDWIEKPIHEEQLANALAQMLNATESERPSILHVEDDRDIAVLVKTITADMADITLAKSLNEARQRLAKEKFDLVILDIGFPDGSGLDLIPALTGNEEPTPVIIFSAQDLDKKITDGVAATLVKSKTNNEQIVAAIKHMIKTRARSKKNDSEKNITEQIS